MGIKSLLTNLFYPQPEQRSTGGEAPSSITYGLSDPKLLEALSLNSGAITVSEETALSLAVVYRCVDVLSSSFASLPWELFRFDGTVTNPAIGHPVRGLLSRPHPLQTSYVWRKTLLTHALLWGNGYARITRNGVGRPVSFKLYHPREVLVTTDLYHNQAYYRFSDVAETLSPDDVLHMKVFSIDGIIGRSVIRQAAESFKIPMQSRRFSTKLLENGARPAGIITHPQKLKIEAKRTIREGWFENYGGENQAGRTAVLDEGMKYEQVGINPVDAQLLELMNLSDEQICSLFGVPQHMAGILRRSTNNNIEHQGLEYLSYGLKPHVENFQQEFDYKALRVQEQGTVGSRLDTDSLQLIDVAAKKDYYQFMRNSGVMSANEIRDKLNMNPYAGGDLKFIQGAMMPIGEDGLPIYPPEHVKIPAPAVEDPKPKNGNRSAAHNGHALPVN